MLNCKAVKIVTKNEDLVYSSMLIAMNELARVEHYNSLMGGPIPKDEIQNLLGDLQDIMEDFSGAYSAWRQQHMGDC